MKPTSGDALIAGNSVLTELAAAQKQIGYCPQFNPLLDFMTAREHLHMYASLKGVPSHNVAEVVNELIQAVGLEKHADRVAGSYSGGNKRKLSLSIALVSSTLLIPTIIGSFCRQKYIEVLKKGLWLGRLEIQRYCFWMSPAVAWTLSLAEPCGTWLQMRWERKT
jgi:ABC-type molybdate transport system ATPase subunit